VRCRRPTVLVGGELTVDMLDLQFNPISKFYVGPVQMKANNGVLIIDDFGRQRIRPEELLNRWVVPLDRRIDFLTMAGGRTIEIPFEMLVVFATNMDPAELADEAFLRRIQTKIRIGSVSDEQLPRDLPPRRRPSTQWSRPTPTTVNDLIDDHPRQIQARTPRLLSARHRQPDLPGPPATKTASHILDRDSLLAADGSLLPPGLLTHLHQKRKTAAGGVSCGGLLFNSGVNARKHLLFALGLGGSFAAGVLLLKLLGHLFPLLGARFFAFLPLRVQFLLRADQLDVRHFGRIALPSSAACNACA
jgi:hypothetical protein